MLLFSWCCWFTMCDQECLSNSNTIVFPAQINLFNAESNHPLRLCCVMCVRVCVSACESGCVRQRPPVWCREPVNSEPECALSTGIWFVTQQTWAAAESLSRPHPPCSSLALSAFPFSSPSTQGVSKGSPLGQYYWHTYLIARGWHPRLSIGSVKLQQGKKSYDVESPSF